MELTADELRGRIRQVAALSGGIPTLVVHPDDDADVTDEHRAVCAEEGVEVLVDEGGEPGVFQLYRTGGGRP